MTKTAEEATDRFLVTMKVRDLDSLDEVCGRLHMSRNRYVMLAIMEKLSKEPEKCPICGRTESHSH